MKIVIYETEKNDHRVSDHHNGQKQKTSCHDDDQRQKTKTKKTSNMNYDKSAFPLVICRTMKAESFFSHF